MSDGALAIDVCGKPPFSELGKGSVQLGRDPHAAPRTALIVAGPRHAHGATHLCRAGLRASATRRDETGSVANVYL